MRISRRRALLSTAALAVGAGGGLFSRASARSLDHSTAERLGFSVSGLEKLAAVFTRMIEESQHPGAQLAIYRNGELAYEIFGGVNRAGGSPVTADTLYQIRSTTKALTAIVMMQAFERGRFRFEDKVAQHWPEFAANGKDAITIAHVLSHQAGIPDGPLIPPAELGNRASVARAVADMTPIWPPGTANGYHAATIGWICNELLQRWEGVDMAHLLTRDVTGPLGAKDVHVGLPSSLFSRMAPMNVDDRVRSEQGLRARFSDFLNTPEGISLRLAWASGVANARSLARVMCIPALRGEVAGRRYYAAATQAIVSAPTNPAGRSDLRLLKSIRWGLGFILGDTQDIYGSTPRPTAIGHAGGGANVIWGDPETRVAVAFLCNKMLSGRQSNDRYRLLGDAIYASLA